MQIYTLIVSFPEDFTLVKLHKYIQAIVEFGDDHLFDFGKWVFEDFQCLVTLFARRPAACEAERYVPPKAGCSPKC